MIYPSSLEKLINYYKKLPGIGEKLAENIISYRIEHGFYQSIEEIKNVPKIGDSIFEKIKDYITIQ